MKTSIVITFIWSVAMLTANATIEEGDLAELQCWLYASYGIFKLTSLEKPGGEDYHQVIPRTKLEPNPRGNLTYNFCAYTQYSKVKTFAYRSEEINGELQVTVLTDNDYRPNSVVGIPNDMVDDSDEHLGHRNYMHLDGISIKHLSPQDCTEKQKHTFTTTILCDEQYSEQGQAEFVSYEVSADDPCDHTLTVKHSSGCPTQDYYYWGMLIENNSWLLGSIYLISGVLIGLQGTKWFRVLSTICAFVIVLLGCLLLALIFGYVYSVQAIVLSLVVSILAAGAVATLCYYVLWIAIGLMGIGFGLLTSVFIYTAFFAKYAWADFWLPILLIVIGLCISVVVSFQYQMQMVMFISSSAGAELVTRGLINWISGDNYPILFDEVVSYTWLDKQIEIDWEDAFSETSGIIYLIISFLLTIGFLLWQCKTVPRGQDRHNLHVKYSSIN